MFHKKKLVTAFFLLIMSSTMALAQSRDVVHDETSGTILRSTSGACVRTKWSSDTDACQTEPVVPVATPRIVPPPPPPPRVVSVSREERTVYFPFNQTGLTPDMKDRLDTLAVKLKSEKSVKGAHIVGYADRIGNSQYNQQLSKKRAEVAQQYLVARGLINTSVADTRWVGSSEPVTQCSSKLPHAKLVDCLQQDRRVEVEIDYFPSEVQASQ